MNPKLTRKLWLKYPNLYRDKNAPITRSLIPFGFECGDGWYDLIDNLSKELEKLCKLENSKLTKKKIAEGYGYRASQVKEKFGTLRFYMSFETDEMSDLIDLAEKVSAETCEICGKPGITRGFLAWVQTLCAWHLIKRLPQYTLKGKTIVLWRWVCSKF
jgi:hypothetical protein